MVGGKLKEGQLEKRAPKKDDREEASRRCVKMFVLLMEKILTCTLALHLDQKS